MIRNSLLVAILFLALTSCKGNSPGDIIQPSQDKNNANADSHADLCVLGAFEIGYSGNMQNPIAQTLLREAELEMFGIWDFTMQAYLPADIQLKTIGYEPSPVGDNPFLSGVVTFKLLLDTTNYPVHFINPCIYVLVNEMPEGTHSYSAYEPDKYGDELEQYFQLPGLQACYLFSPDEFFFLYMGTASKEFKIRISPDNPEGEPNDYPIAQGYPDDKIMIIVVAHQAYVAGGPCPYYPLNIVDVSIDPVENSSGQWAAGTYFECKLKNYDLFDIGDDCAVGKLTSPLFGNPGNEAPLIFNSVLRIWELDPGDMPVWADEIEPGNHTIRVHFDVENSSFPMPFVIEKDISVLAYEPNATETDHGFYYVDYLKKINGYYGLYRAVVAPSGGDTHTKHTQLYWEQGWDVQNHSVSEDGRIVAFDVIQKYSSSPTSRIIVLNLEMDKIVGTYELPVKYYPNIIKLGYEGVPFYGGYQVRPDAPSHPVLSADGNLLVYQVDFKWLIEYPEVVDQDEYLPAMIADERFIRAFGIPFSNGVLEDEFVFEIYDGYQDAYPVGKYQYDFDPQLNEYERIAPRLQYSCWGPQPTNCDLNFSGYLEGETNPSTPAEGVAIFVDTDVDLNGDYDSVLNDMGAEGFDPEDPPIPGDPEGDVPEQYVRIVRKGDNHVGCGLFDIGVPGEIERYGFYYITDGGNKESIGSADFEAEQEYLYTEYGIMEDNLDGNMSFGATNLNPRPDPDGYLLAADALVMSLGEDGPSSWGENGVCRNIDETNCLTVLPWIWRGNTEDRHRLNVIAQSTIWPGGGGPGAFRGIHKPSGMTFLSGDDNPKRVKVIYHAGFDVLGNTYITEFYLDEGKLIVINDELSSTYTVTVNLAHDNLFNLDHGYDNSPCASPDGHGFAFTSQYLSNGDIYFFFIGPDGFDSGSPWNTESDVVSLRLTYDAVNTGPAISGRILP